MKHRRHEAIRFAQLLWLTIKGPKADGLYLINAPLPKSGLDACISSRITTVIQVVRYHQINNNCFNEPFADSPFWGLFLHMHGLAFVTSIWLLAGSTRYLVIFVRDDTKGKEETSAKKKTREREREIEKKRERERRWMIEQTSPLFLSFQFLSFLSFFRYRMLLCFPFPPHSSLSFD